MTLKRRLATQILVMVAGVLLLGAAAVVGVRGLHSDFGLALRANEQTRAIYTIGVHVASARTARQRGAVGEARAEMAAAAGQYDVRQDGWIAGTERDAATLGRVLREAADDPSAADAAYTALANLSAATRQVLARTQAAADRKQQATLATAGALSAAVALVVVIVGIRQYRTVTRPLGRVRAGVRRIASGHLGERLPVDGDVEFAALAADFNRMADELAALYADMERRIDAKSRELVRSERLASVGYLAAGVAHEINNPLGIIAGYGERSLQRLHRDTNAQTLAYVRRAIGVMCDEAFRCKAITDRLLKLARPGAEARGRVPVATLAREVVASVGVIDRFAGRRVTVDVSGDDAVVIGNEGELRQLILNLLVNALEADEPNRAAGEVRLTVRRTPAEVELSVRDNGRGMSAQTAARVFEPFFTEKRGERPGTGLGLSLAHSIVTAHGGSIEARSEGAGRGSEFLVRLPAPADAREEVCDVRDE